MTADLIKHEQAGVRVTALPPEQPTTQRTAEEKALILARLTLQLAALGQTGGPQDGNA
jgi:hypothetical protein